MALSCILYSIIFILIMIFDNIGQGKGTLIDHSFIVTYWMSCFIFFSCLFLFGEPKLPILFVKNRTENSQFQFTKLILNILNIYETFKLVKQQNGKKAHEGIKYPPTLCV